MKQYKLLKDTPESKEGGIFIYSVDNHRYECILSHGVEHYSACSVENNPEWFEEVKSGFVKEFKVYDNYPYKDIVGLTVDLRETFETIEQAEAMKELKRHIYRFDEPKKNEDYYSLGWDIDMFPSRFYGGDITNHVCYVGGHIINKKATPEDREERIRLLKKAYNI